MSAPSSSSFVEEEGNKSIICWLDILIDDSGESSYLLDLTLSNQPQTWTTHQSNQSFCPKICFFSSVVSPFEPSRNHIDRPFIQQHLLKGRHTNRWIRSSFHSLYPLSWLIRSSPADGIDCPPYSSYCAVLFIIELMSRLLVNVNTRGDNRKLLLCSHRNCMSGNII